MAAAKVELAAADAAAHSDAQEERQVNTQTQRLVLQIQAVEAVEQIVEDLAMPATVQGRFAGTAQMFRASLVDQPLLILAAVIAVYIVLGILYERIGRGH